MYTCKEFKGKEETLRGKRAYCGLQSVPEAQQGRGKVAWSAEGAWSHERNPEGEKQYD